MDWKLHLIVSFLIYFSIILFFQFPLDYSVAAFILLAFSSLLPDIDHPKSIIRAVVFAMIFSLLILFVLIQISVGLETRVITMFIILILTYYFYKKMPLRHRGKRSLHLWRYCLLTIVVSFVLFEIANINITLILFIFIGYGSHLLADKIKKF